MFKSLLGTQSSTRSSDSSRHRHRRDRDDDDDSRSKSSSHSHHRKSSRHHSSSSKHKSSRSDDRDADRHSSSRRSSRRHDDEDDGARSIIAPSEIASEAPSRTLDGERSTFGDDPNDHYKERRARRRGHGDDDSMLDQDSRDPRRRERETYPEELRYRDDAPSAVDSDLRDSSRRDRDLYWGEPRQRSRDRYNDDDRRSRSSRRYDEPNADDRYEPATRSERRSRTLDDRAIPEGQRPIEPAGRRRTAASGPESSRSPLYTTDTTYPLPTTSGPENIPQSSYGYPPPTSGSYPPADSSQQPPLIGSAAEYYGDQGQSVPNQPGFTPSAISPSGPEYAPPSMPIPQFDQHEAGPSGPPPQHGTGTAALGGMAAGAAGYGINSAMSGGSPSSGPPNTSPTMPGSMPADMPSNSLPNAPSGHPDDRPQHHSSSSHGGLAALGATAGIAAAAGLAANAYHNSHHNSHGNHQQTPYSHSQQQNYNGGFQQGNLAYQRRQQGPLRKFVDFWRDPEGVALYEEYSEITGTCRYCFEPGTTSRDAPRKHNRYRRRPSNDSFGGRSRVDKLSRYGSSEEEGHHKSSNRKSWLAAGLAAYVGKSLWDKGKKDRRDRSPSIRRPKSSSSSSVGGRGATSYGQTTVSEYSHPQSTIGGGQKLDRYDSRSDVSKPSISAHSRSKSEGHRRRDRSRSSSSDSKSGRSGLKTAAIAAGALGTAAAMSSASHARKERRVRAGNRSRSPRKSRRRYSSSSSSSMIDISRPSANKGLASFSNFFSAPSEKSRMGRTGPRRKQRNLFGLGSTYSSSDDADLAFGSGFLKSRTSKKGKGRKRDEDIDHKLIGLGATAAGLAASASIANGRRHHGLIAVKERKSKHEAPADNVWESVSDESSSADSGLAYGGPSSNSRDSFTSDSGTSKWRWRWGSSKKKKKVSQPLEYPNKQDGYGRNSQASFAPPSSTYSLPSMQNVDPIPASEQSLTPYRDGRNSTGGPSAFDTTKPMLISHSENTELGQPKPVAPISDSFYTRGDYETEKPKPIFKEIAPAVAGAVAGAALIGTAHEYYNDHPLKDSKGPATADVSKPKDISSAQSNREQHDSYSDAGPVQHRQNQIMPPPPASLPGKFDQGPLADDVKVDRSRKARDDSDISTKKAERRRRNSSPALEDHYTYVTPSDLSKRSSAGKGVHFDLTKEQQDKEMRQLELEGEKAARRYQRDEEPASDPESRISKSKRLHRPEISPPLPDEKFEEPLSDKDAESWSMPARVAFPVLSGAAAVAADRIIDEKKRKREERRKERRGYSESEAGSSAVSRQRFDSPDRRFVEEPGELTEKPLPNPKTKPTYENYATYFAPPELRRESSAESAPESTPAPKPGATKFRVIEPRSSPLDTELTRAESTKPTNLPWPVPHLNLIEPTPPQSRTGSVLSHSGETKDLPVADPIVTVPEQAAAQEDRDDTYNSVRNKKAGHIATSETPLPGVPGAAKKLSSDGDMEVIPSKARTRELPPSPEIPSPPHHMPGEFGDDIDFAATLAAGTAMSGFDPSIVTDNPAYHRRASPPRSEGGHRDMHKETPVSYVHHVSEREPLPLVSKEEVQAVPARQIEETTSEAGKGTFARDMQDLPSKDADSSPPEPTAAKLSKKDRKKQKAAQKKSRDAGEKDLELDWEEQPAITPSKSTEADRKVRSDNINEPKAASRDLFDVDDKQNKAYRDLSSKGMVNEREEVPGNERETWQDAAEDIRPRDSSTKPVDISSPAREFGGQLPDNNPRASMPGNFEDVWADIGPVGGKDKPSVPADKGPADEPELATAEKSKKKSKGKSKQGADEPSPVASETVGPSTREIEIDEPVDRNVESGTATSVPDVAGLERGKSKSKRRSKRYAELIDSRSEVGDTSKPDDDNVSVVSRAKSEAAKDSAKGSDKSRGFFGLFGSSSSADKKSSTRERDRSPPPSEVSTSSKKKKKSKKDRHADEDAINADDNDLPASRDIEPVNADDADNDNQQRQKSKDRKKDRKNRYEQIVESGKASDDEDKNRYDTSRQAKNDTLGKEQPSGPFLDDSPGITSVPAAPLKQAPAAAAEKAFDSVSAPISTFPLPLNLPSRGRSRSVTPLPGEKIVDLPTQSHSRPSSRSRSPPGTAKRISWRGGFNFGDPNSSPTAIPIQLRRPPSTPDRGAHDGQVSPSRPKSGHKRPKSTEFKTNREFRPLWLVERHTSKTELPEEETYPSLPSSKSTSRMSSVEDLRAKALEDNESMDIFSTPRRRPSLHVATNDSSFDVDILGSQQATPTAHSFRPQDRKPKEKPKYEFHSPSELLEGPMSSRSALSDVPQSSDGTVIPDNRVQELEDMDLQNLPPLPESPVHEDPKSRELDITPEVSQDVQSTSHREPEVEAAETPAETRSETVSLEHLPPLPDSRPSTPIAEQGVETEELVEDIDRSSTPRPTHRELDEVPADTPTMISAAPDSGHATPTQLSPTYRASEASEYESVDEDHFVDASSQALMSPSYQKDFNSPTTPTQLAYNSEPHGAVTLLPPATAISAYGVPGEGSISKDTDSESVMTVTKDDSFGGEPKPSAGSINDSELELPSERAKESEDKTEVPAPSKSKKNKKKKKKNLDAEPTSTAQSVEPEVRPAAEPAPEPAAEPVSGSQAEEKAPVNISTDTISSTATDHVPSEEPALSTGIGEESSLEPVKEDLVAGSVANKPKKGKSKKGRKNKSGIDSIEGSSQESNESSAGISTRKDNFAITQDEGLGDSTREVAGAQLDDMVIDSVPDINSQLQHARPGIVDAIPPMANLPDTEKDPKEAPVSGEVLAQDVPLPVADLEEIDALNFVLDEQEPTAATMAQINDHLKDNSASLPLSPEQKPQDIPLPLPSAEEADLLETTNERSANEPALLDRISGVTGPSFPHEPPVTEVAPPLADTDIHKIESEDRGQPEDPEPAAGMAGIPIGDASHESNFPTTTGHGQLLPKLEEDILPTPFSANLVDEKGIHSGTDMFFDAAQNVDALAKHELPDELADKEPEPYTPAIKSEELAEPEPKQKKKKGKKGKKDRKNSASIDNIEASASPEQPLVESPEVPVRSNETEEAPTVAWNEETVEQPSIEEGSLSAKGAEALPLSTNDDANAAEPGVIANDTPPHIPGDNSSQDVRSTSKQSKKQKKKDKKKQELLNSTLNETVPEAINVEENTEKSTLAVHDTTTATEESSQDQPVNKAIVTPVLLEEPKGTLVDIPVDEEPTKEDTLLTGAKLEVPTQVDIRDERAVEEDSNIIKATEGSEAMRFNLPHEEANLQAETIPSTGENAVKLAKAKKDKKGKKGKKNREVLSLEDEDQSSEKGKPADGQSSMALEAEPSTLGSPPAEEKPTEPVGGLPMDANDVPVETHVENALTGKEKKKRKKNRSVSAIDEAQPVQKSSPPDVPEVDTEAQGSIPLEVQDDPQNTEVSEPLAEAPSAVDKLLTESEPIETFHEQGLASDNIPMDSQASEQVADQPLGVDGSRIGYQPLEPSTRTASEINDTLEGPHALEAHKNENLQEPDPRPLESSTLHQPLPFESTPQPLVEEPSEAIKESPAPADKPVVSEPPGEKPANSEELAMEASGEMSLPVKGKKKKNRNQSQSLDEEPQAVESSSLIQESSIETPRDGPSDPEKDASAEQRDDEPHETLGNREVNVQQDMLIEPPVDKLRPVDIASSEVPVDIPLAPKEKKKKRKKKGQSISIDEEPKAIEFIAPVSDLWADPLKDAPKETLRDVEAQEDLRVDKHLQTQEEEALKPRNVRHQDTESPAPIEDSSAETLQDMPSENMALVEDTPVDSGSSKTQQGGPTDILQDRQPETQQIGDSRSIEGEPITTLEDKRPEVTESAEGEQPKSIPSDVLELEPKDIIDENQPEPKLSDPQDPLPAELTDDKRLDVHHISIQEDQEGAPVVPHEVQAQSQIESSEPKVESAELEDDNHLKPQSDQLAENQKGDVVESHEEQSTDIVDTASMEPPIELTSTPKDKKKKKKKKGQPKALDNDTEVIETPTTVDQLPVDTVDQPVPETPIEKPLTAKEKKKLKKHQKKLSLEQESQPVTTPGVADTPSVETQKEQDLEVDTSLPYSAGTHAEQPLLDQGIEKDQETPHLEELPIPKEAGQPSETLAVEPSTEEPLAIGNDLLEQHIDKPLSAKERKKKRQEKATTSLEDEPVAKEESVSRESALDDAFGTEPIPEEQTPEKPLSAKEKKKKKKKSQEDQAAGEEFSAKPEEVPGTSESTSVEFMAQEVQDVDNTPAEAPFEQPLTAKEKKKGKKDKKSKQSVGWTDEVPQTPQGLEIPRECETEASIPTESTATTAVISSAEPSQENIEGKSQGPKEQPTDVASTQPGMVEMDIGRTAPRITEPQGDGGEVETGNPDEDGKEFQLSKSQKKNKSKKKAEVSCWTDEIPPTQVDNGPAIPPTELESQQRSLPFDEEPLKQPDTSTNASDALRNDALDNLPATDADLAVSESKPSHSLANVDGQPEDVTIVEEKLMETPVNDATRPDMVSLPESVGETTEQHLAPEKTQEGIKPSMEIQSTGPGPSLDDQIMENIQESATENPADESLSDKSKGLSSTGLGDALTEPSIPELQDQSTPIPPSISLSSRPDAEGRLVDLRGAGASVDTKYSEPIKEQEIQVSKSEAKIPESGPIDFTISEKICEHPPPEQSQAEISDAMQETPTELPKPEELGLALLSTEQSTADDNDSAATPLNRHTTDDVPLSTIPQLTTVSDELPARDTSKMSKKEKKKKKKKGVMLEGEPVVAPELPEIKMQTLPEEPSAPEPLIADMKEESLRTLSKKEQKAAKKKARGAVADVVKSDFKEDVEAVNSTPNVPKITADITKTTDFNKVDDAPTTEEPAEVGIEQTHGLETQPISTDMTVDSAGKDTVTPPIPPFVDDNMTEPEPVGAAAEISHEPTWDEGSGPRKKSKKQKERTKGTITSQTETDAPGELKDPELEIQLVREEPAQEPVLSGQSSKRNKKKKKKGVRGLSGDVEAPVAEEKEIEANTIDAPVCPDVDMPVAGEAASPKEDEVNNEREMDTASLDLQLSGDHEVINDTPEIQHTVLPKTMTPGIGDFSEDTAPKCDDVPEKPVETFAGETGQKPKGESMSEIHDTRAPQSAAETLAFGGGAVEERGPDQDVSFGEKIDAKFVPMSRQTPPQVIDSAMEIDSSFKENSQPVAMEHAAVDDSTNKDVPMKDLGAEPSVEQTASEFHDSKEPVMALSQETQGTEPTLDTGASPVGTEISPQLADKGETVVPYDISIGTLQGEDTWPSTEGKGEKVKKSKKSKGRGKALERDKAETETPLFETQELQAPSTAKHEMTKPVEPTTGLTPKQPEEEAIPSKEKGKSKAKGLVGEDLGWTEATEIGSQDLAILQQDSLDSPDPLSKLVPEFVSGPSTEPPPEVESAFLTTDEKENKPKNKKNEKPAVVETEQPEDSRPPISAVEPEIPTEVTAAIPKAAREEVPEPEAEFLPNVTKRKGKKTKAKGKRPANVGSTIEAGERHSEVTPELSREPEEPVKSNEPSFLFTTGPGGGPEEDISLSVTSKKVKQNKKKNKTQLSEDLVADTTKTQLLTPEPELATKPASLESLEAPDWSRKHELHPGDDKAARQDTGTSEDLTVSQALDIGASGNEPSGADLEPVNQAPEDVQVLDKSMAEPEAMIPTPKREYNDDPFSVESSSKERSSALLFHSSPSTRDFGYMTPATHELHDQHEERPSTPTPMHLHKSIETDKPLDHADDTTPHALLSTPEKEISRPTTAEDIAPRATEQARPSLEPPSLFGGPYGLAERERSVSRSVSPPKTPLGTIEEHSAISAPYEAQHPPAFPPLTPDAAPASRGPEKKQQAQPQTWATPAVNPVHTPESTPPKLRRVKSRRSSDLKAASERDFRRGRTRTPSPSLSQEEQEYQEDEEARQLPSSSTYDPVTDKGKAPLRGMAADVYEGWGDVQGAPPLSPTRPPSVRRRRSLQRLQELETRLDQLVSENRLLGSSKAAAEKAIESHAVAQRQHARALEARDQTIQNKELEIQQLQKSSDWLKKEITRLTEVNEGLAAANASYAASRGLDGGNKSNYKEEWEKSQRELEKSQRELEKSQRELEKVRAQYAQLFSGLEQMVKHEVGTALADKDAEIQLLRDNLADAQDKIKELQEQIQASAKDDILVFHDEDYFDNACQKLCQHVQQWVLRFSKFSDMRVCRTTSVLRDEKIVDRFENAILDGTDVDTYLSDRVGRRDVFMSVAMTMMWEYIFTRYLFGMDREQRQKLKTLEKHLSEVGPPNAVHKWRATTLTLLSKRPSFKELRSQDTEAVVQEIYRTLSKLLPPPHELEKTVLDSLRNVMRSAVDLSIKMRTQRAEYIMLPPLQPEYDTNGELLRKVYFNAALMNERSGETTSNEELEAQRAVVRMVLFPLVVKKGSDEGDGDEEIVVCPAQVLVARPPKERKSSKGLSADRQSIRSTQSFPSISMAPSNPSNIM